MSSRSFLHVLSLSLVTASAGHAAPNADVSHQPGATRTLVAARPLDCTARLVGAWILFHTNDEDKDHDTRVTTRVYGLSRALGASQSELYGKFRDHSDHGWYELSVSNKLTQCDLNSGSIHIRVDPNGNDTWRFNATVFLGFDNGTYLETFTNDTELDEDNRDGWYGIRSVGPVDW